MKRLALAFVAACGFRPNGAVIGAVDGGSADADATAGPCVPWAAVNVAPCDQELGTPGDVTIGSGISILDTDSGELSGPVSTTLPGALVAQAMPGPQVRVVNASELHIGSDADVDVVGSHPLVFVVHGDAVVDGELDVSAQVAESGVTTPGPGADDPMQCMMSFGAPGMASTGVGGGGGAGGGGFGDSGGNGGDGDGAMHGNGGGHGMAGGMPMLTPLRGGCSGGSGGTTLSGSPAASFGGGGGGVEITALHTITVTGTLLASGAGGGVPASSINGGGGGGGAGGAILLDGDVVVVAAGASLCANGGGGGAGGSITDMSTPGAPGTCSTTTVGSGGTDPDEEGGTGGSGGGATSTAGTKGANGPGGDVGGGGGGGGSVGRIRVLGRTTHTIDGSATVTPGPAS